MDDSSSIRLSVSSSLIAWEPSPGTLYTIDGVAKAASLSRRVIALYSREGLLKPAFEPGETGWYFNAEAIHTLRKIEKLRVIHRLDSSGVRLVFGLFKEIERLRREMDYPVEF